MMNRPIKLLHSRKKSFGHAIDGLKVLFGTQANARIHLLITVLVIIIGIILNISTTEWLFVALLIGFVFFAEAVNTSIERTVDLISPDYHIHAKQAKDLGAAAVLISAITAVAGGILIFLPKILALLQF